MRESFVAVIVGAVAGTLPALLTSDSAPPMQPVIQWVVEDGASYSGPRGGPGVHYVTCVPEADLVEPREQREVWREVEVAATTAYDYVGGEPCPAGRIRLEWPSR